jgi:hypothetical protein
MNLAKQMNEISKNDAYKSSMVKDIVLSLIKIYSEYHLFELEYHFRPQTTKQEKHELCEFLFNEGFRAVLLSSEHCLFVSWRNS